MSKDQKKGEHGGRIIKASFVQEADQIAIVSPHNLHRQTGKLFTIVGLKATGERVTCTTIEGKEVVLTSDQLIELVNRPKQLIPGYFIQLSKAWYGASNLRGADYMDEVFIGSPDSGIGMAFRWYQLHDHKMNRALSLVGHPLPSARLEVFDEAWSYLATLCAPRPWIPDFPNLFARAGRNSFQPDELPTELVKLGFTDATPRSPEPHHGR